MRQDTLTKATILLMTLGITALFLAMIQPFVMTLVLAGIGSALIHPFYLGLQRRLGGSAPLAALLTIFFMTIMILIPGALVVTVLISQALDVSQLIRIWVRAFIEDPRGLMTWLEHLPFYEQVMQHRDLISQQMGQGATLISKILVDWVSAFAFKAIHLLLLTFVFLYSLFFFLIDGHKLIQRILYYLPLHSRDEQILLDKFSSVTRATFKGTVLIGILQGGLAGVAFAIAGISDALFWGTVMAVLSIIPNVGASLIWAPAVAILIAQGKILTGILLGLFCGLVVGTLDNLLRPILVGKDTKMHELMIFLSTLGGILMFGLPGLFVGPIIGSLLISIWEIYGVEFAEVLPRVDGFPNDLDRSALAASNSAPAKPIR